MIVEKINIRTTRKILNDIAEFPLSTTKEIAERTETSIATVHNYLKTFYKKGIVKYSKKGKSKLWSLSDAFIAKYKKGRNILDDLI